MFIKFSYKVTTMRSLSALVLAASTVCFGLPSMAQNVPCLVWIAPGACGVEDTLHPDHPSNQRRDPQPSYTSAPDPLAEEIGKNFARALGEIFELPSEGDLDYKNYSKYSHYANPNFESFQLPAPMVWIVVASRKNEAEAIILAKQYSEKWSSTQVFLSRNGWYAIGFGAFFRSDAEKNIIEWKKKGIIPSDATLSTGESYVDRVWATEERLISER